MAEAVAADILRRHGVDAPAALLPRQGVGAFAWVAGDVVLKLARPGCAAEIVREALAAPIARAAGVRTPALLAAALDGDEPYTLWQRVDGAPLAEREEAAAWRDLGRQLAILHLHARGEQGGLPGAGILYARDKRDGRPHLHALAPERAAFFARWLDRLERVPAAPARLLHNDVHALNVLCPPAGATLIDWGDAGWGDPASELGSIPMPRVPDVLDGYEEVASPGQEVEARILRAVIGHGVRKLAERGRERPLRELQAFLDGDVPARWRGWLPQ